MAAAATIKRDDENYQSNKAWRQTCTEESNLELLSTQKPASESAIEVEVVGAGGTALQTSTTS